MMPYVINARRRDREKDADTAEIICFPMKLASTPTGIELVGR
jgi:hypothetical protein